jgi:hypothetical protein
MEGAGFVNVTQQRSKIPLGLWPRDPRLKKIGACSLLQFLEGFEGFTLAGYTRVLGWSKDQVQTLGHDVKRDALNPRIHSMFEYHVVYAQKPLDAPAVT